MTLKLNLKYETLIINGNKVRYYFDKCATCGKEIKRKVCNLGKDCFTCSRIKKNKNISIKNSSFDRETPKKRKIYVRGKTRRAIKNGSLIKTPCIICGSLISNPHHTDYSRWWDVLWLCKKHHVDIHNDGIIY